MKQKHIADGDEGSKCIGAQIATEMNRELREFFDQRRLHQESYGDGMGIFAGYGEEDKL